MKQYKHSIARSKLEKAHLSKKQISKVYSFKTKAKQEKAFKSIASGVRLARSNKFLKYGFAESILLKKQQKIADYSKTEEFKKLPKIKQAKLEKQFWSLENRIIQARIYRASTKQIKQDLIDARKARIEDAWAKINAGEKAYYINKTREESYASNNTINQSKEEFLAAHFPTEYQERIDKNVPIDTIIEELWDLAIKTGLVKELAQGSGYGYISDDYKEVISPV